MAIEILSLKNFNKQTPYEKVRARKQRFSKQAKFADYKNR